MQSDGNHDELNMDLSENEQAVIDAAAKESTEAADKAAADKTAAEDDATKAAAKNDDAPDPLQTALSASAKALENSNRLIEESNARADAAARSQAEAKAAEDAKAAAETVKEPDWDALKKELAEKNTNGELDDEEFEERREALFEQKATWKAEAAAQARFEKLQAEAEARNQAKVAQTQEQEWDSAFKAFSDDADNKFILDDPSRTRAFNAELQAVGEANPDLSYAEMLAKARTSVLQAFGVQQNAEDKQKADIKKEEARRAAEAGRGPPNLNNLPNAGTDLSGGKYAHLDAMDIDSLENTLAGMPRAEVEAYLASSPGSNTRGTTD